MPEAQIDAQPAKALKGCTESIKPDTPDAARMQREESDALNLYRQCMEIRNFEIQNLVNRNNFFMVFQGVLMAGVIQGSKDAPPLIIFLASACGFLISVFQVGMSQGAKYWQEAWEYRLARAELRLKAAFYRAKGITDRDELAQASLAAPSGIEAASKATASSTASGATSDEVVTEAEVNAPTAVGQATTLKDALVAYPPIVFQEMFSRSGDGTRDDVKTSLRLSGVKHNFVVKRWSVSKIPIYSGIVFSVFWLVILLHTIKSPFGSYLPSLLVALPR